MIPRPKRSFENYEPMEQGRLKKPSGRRVASPKGAKAKADRYFSLLVRARGRCQVCGTQQNLQCAHIISRRFSNTRCNPKNALCLCAGCHHYYTDHPYEWAKIVDQFITEAEYGELQEAAHSLRKMDWEARANELAAEWKASQ